MNIRIQEVDKTPQEMIAPKVEHTMNDLIEQSQASHCSGGTGHHRLKSLTTA